MNKKIISKITASILLGTIIAYASPVFAYTKDETVYTKLDSDGNSYSTIVNNHIKNDEKLSIINDLTDLLNIKNVGSDENPNIDENKLVWNSNGEDVYYQGSTNKELPIECKIKYELNGEEISKEEIAGKSGKIKIVIEYINKDSHIVSINGRNVTMYTPFVVVCGAIVDNNNNKNIEIRNGKAIDNGDKTTLIGISVPGMQESLDISKDKLEIPNTVEITMESSSFELGNIITYATSKLLEESDLELVDNLDQIYNKVNELQSASNQLADGSNSLKDGSLQLNTGIKQLSYELNSVMNQYENTRNNVDKNEIKKQIINILNQEIDKMLPDIEKQAKIEAKNAIENHKEELESSVVDTSIKYTNLAINEKLNEIQKNNGNILTQEQEKQLRDAIAKDIKEVYESAKNDIQINSYLNELEISIKKEIKNVINNAIDSKKIDVSKLTPQQIEGLRKKYAKEIANIKVINNSITDLEALQIIGVVSNSTLTNVETEINKKIDNISVGNATQIEEKIKIELNKYITSVSQNIANKFTQGNMELLKEYEKNMQKSIVEALKQKLSNDEVLKSYGNKAKLELNNVVDSVANKTAQDLASTYTSTIANEVANNLIKKQLNGEFVGNEIDKKLSKYESSIREALGEVDNKVEILKSALSQLEDGSNQLANGSIELADGMNKFKSEGIENICNYINGDLKDITDRIEKLKELSKQYNNFTMLEDGNNGNVKFIMITDSIKIENDNKEKIVADEKK